MKKLLYATGNKYKIESMKKRLEGMDIEIISPKELNINIKVAGTPINNDINITCFNLFLISLLLPST